jgi:hypothetical protein
MSEHQTISRFMGIVGTISKTILDMVNGGILCQNIELVCEAHVLTATKISVRGF